MLFDPSVKVNRADLFDRERELSELIEAIRLRERLIIVYGVRRVGKTSLVNVAIREVKEPFIIIDVRKLYFESGLKAILEKILVKELIKRFSEQRKLLESFGVNLRELFSKIRSIRVGPVEIELVSDRESPSLTELLEEINEWFEKHNRVFLIMLDEAQYMRYSNKRFDLLLAWTVDNLRNIIHVLTGSEVGLLREFLRLETGDSALSGRARREVYVERFSEEESLKFLHKGFAELSLNPSINELQDTVKTLDGIPGWLTLYGYYRATRGTSHEKTLKTVLDEGAGIVFSELESLIKPSRIRYLAILRAVASGLSSWSDIKAFVESRTGPVPDNRFNELLNKLVKYGYLKKDNSLYSIPDPIVKYTLLEKIR